MTTLFSSSRSLEHGIFTLADEGTTEDLPDFDPNLQAIHVFASTLVVAAIHETDGDALITILLADPDPPGPPLPKCLGNGYISLPTGDLSLYTASWTDLDRFPVAAGDYRVAIYGTDEEFPSHITVVLSKVELQQG